MSFSFSSLSERPAERAPLCISMHRRGGAATHSPACPCAARDTRVSPGRRCTRCTIYPRANDGTNAGLRQMIYRACRSTARFPADGTLPTCKSFAIINTSKAQRNFENNSFRAFKPNNNELLRFYYTITEIGRAHV